jgi:hypothetical protein
MAKKQKPRAVQMTIFDIGGNPLDQELITEVERAVIDTIKDKTTVAQNISIDTKVE